MKPRPFLSRPGKRPRKLTPREVLEIRTIYAEGEISKRRLARAYRVSPSTIAQIVMEDTWPNARDEAMRGEI